METSIPNVRLGRRQLLVGAAAAAVSTSCAVIAEEVAEQVIDNTIVTGFGQMINLGPVDEVIAAIRENNGFWYQPQGRMWIVAYPAESLPRARATYSSSELVGMEVGIVALFQKCPHLGCRVPSCATSQWFECPCHGSKYNQVGEKRGGPSPRGMDRFAIAITESGEVVVNTAEIIQGPAIGTNTTGQEAAGPNCIGEASH